MENNKKNTSWQYIDPLLNLGLGTDEAKLYEYLLKNGSERASKLGVYTGLSRVLTYRGLKKLAERGLITREDPENGVAIFTANHPSSLSTVLEKQKQRVTHAELELQSTLGAMSSDYNLLEGKPNVQFFEGMNAVKRVTSDYPEVDTEIRQWLDLDSALKEIGNRVKEYLDIRVSKGVSKRMIVPQNEPSVAYARRGTPMTKFRVQKDTMDFPTAIQVYDDTVSMLTINETRSIGLVIQDAAIAETMKKIFDASWLNLENPETT